MFVSVPCVRACEAVCVSHLGGLGPAQKPCPPLALAPAAAPPPVEAAHCSGDSSLLRGEGVHKLKNPVTVDLRVHLDFQGGAALFAAPQG